MFDATTQDKQIALDRLAKTLVIYKATNRLEAKQDAIAAYIGVQSVIEPRTYNRRTSDGIKRRHQIRDELHTLEQDAFLRRLSELLHVAENK